MKTKLKVDIKNNSQYCCYCGERFASKKQKTIDHLKCKSKGGKRTLGNIACCCEKCNRLKADKDLDLWLKDIKIRANLIRYLIIMESWNSKYSQLIFKKIKANI